MNLTDTTEIANVPSDVVLRTEQAVARIDDLVALPPTEQERYFFETVQKFVRALFVEQFCGYRRKDGVFQVHFNKGILGELDTRNKVLRIVDNRAYLTPLKFPETPEQLFTCLLGFSARIEGTAACYTVPANVQRLPESLRIT